MDMFTQGLVAAATIIYLLSYFKLRRVFGAALFIDVAVTAGLIWMFAGSYAGMMTGVIGGLIVSMFLRIGRRVAGTETPRIARKKGRLSPSFIWVRKR